jgi:hypothetical protein
MEGPPMRIGYLDAAYGRWRRASVDTTPDFLLCIRTGEKEATGPKALIVFSQILHLCTHPLEIWAELF